MTSQTPLQSWALPQLQPLFPLSDDQLLEAVAYAATLPSPDAVTEHFKGLLGESHDAIRFITDFNTRLFPPSSSPAPSSQPQRRGKKQKAPLNRFPNAPRQPDSSLIPGGKYLKRTDDDDYYSGARKSPSGPSTPRNASPAPPKTSTAGTLTSHLPNVRAKTSKKITVPSGQSMRGKSADISDLSAALKELELSTNPTISHSGACDCAGLLHEPLAAAPNCLSCGKIICMLEGLGPCSFCGGQLLSKEDTRAMISALHDAREHRDRLLGFQAENAQRTKIIDETADFEVGTGGLTWMTPAERAVQLKRQQKILQKMEWDAKEAYEKRHVVVAIDLKGRKVVREMREVEMPVEEEVDEPEALADGVTKVGGGGTGSYAKNPLLKGMVKPVWKPDKGKGVETGSVKGVTNSNWRRVQDSLEDNEAILLDGGSDPSGPGDEDGCG